MNVLKSKEISSPLIDAIYALVEKEIIEKEKRSVNLT